MTHTCPGVNTKRKSEIRLVRTRFSQIEGTVVLNVALNNHPVDKDYSDKAH